MKLQFRVFCNILQYVQCRKAGLDEICGMAVKTGAPLENGVSWPFFLGKPLYRMVPHNVHNPVVNIPPGKAQIPSAAR